MVKVREKALVRLSQCQDLMMAAHKPVCVIWRQFAFKSGFVFLFTEADIVCIWYLVPFQSFLVTCFTQWFPPPTVGSNTLKKQDMFHLLIPHLHCCDLVLFLFIFIPFEIVLNHGIDKKLQYRCFFQCPCFKISGRMKLSRLLLPSRHHQSCLCGGGAPWHSRFILYGGWVVRYHVYLIPGTQ